MKGSGRGLCVVVGVKNLFLTAKDRLSLLKNTKRQSFKISGVGRLLAIFIEGERLVQKLEINRFNVTTSIPVPVGLILLPIC